VTNCVLHPGDHTVNPNRREFLAALAVAGATLPAWSAPAARWPVTCRDAHLKATGQPDCWAAMKFLGVDGVELDVNEKLECSSLYYPERPYTLADADGLKRVKEDFRAQGRIISAFCMHNRLDERLEEEVAWTARLVKAAVQLEVGVIRIDVYPRKITGDAVLPFAIKACRQLCDTAAGTPVRFGIENHGKITNDPEFLDKLFDAVGSPKLGLTLDFMNFYWFGHPLNELEGIFRKFAPRAFHTHCKNLRYPEDRRNVRRPMGWEYQKHAAPLYDGDIDYRRAAAILRQAGYAGDLCLENECLKPFPKEQHPAILKKEIELLRSVV